MTREEFKALRLVPGLVMLEVEDGSRFYEAMQDQPCRIVKFAHGYAGPLEVGMLVMLGYQSDRVIKYYYGDGLPLGIFSLDVIVAVLPR